MEAKALFDFNSTQPDEMSFKKGAELLVISMAEYPYWFKARHNDREGMIPANYIEMKPHPWYIRNCSRKDAENRLLELTSDKQYLQPDGAFILRDSENHPGLFSISVKLDKQVLHFRVFVSTDGKYYVWSTVFKSINELIEHHRNTTIYGNKNTTLKNFYPSRIYKLPEDDVKKATGNAMGGVETPRGALNDPHSPLANISNSKINSNNNLQNSQNPVQQQQQQQNASNFVLPNDFTTKMAGRYCVAHFDFAPEYAEELAFKAGDQIKILGEEDENWWFGEIVNRGTSQVRRGLFPSNYVKLLPIGENAGRAGGNTHSTNMQAVL